MNDENRYPGQLVFGLDIGTRSIVGTVGYKKDQCFYVVAQTGKEHQTRAMLDGQIHDIEKVADTIREVKENLEKTLGRPLKKVCIAAAGRVLKTLEIHSTMDLAEEKNILAEDIYQLHSLATEDAYKKFLNEEAGNSRFYCVGSSVIRYYQNEYPILNLLNHKAKKIGIDLIATFLPDEVVDGLYKAVEMADLEVENLTLEPIAAIQLAIPEKFRLLNIALVDVGAGTSDISITNDGTIIAFGMIPLAGDSLTEDIARHCMVDFNTAEIIKRQADDHETISYEDIMGMTQTISKKEVEELLRGAVDQMTDLVAKKIKELNGNKSVGAVFVVGGGGKIPGYTDSLSEKLSIAKERVALRGKEVMQNIIFEHTDLKQDSLLVTPIGICLNFYEESNNFIYVNFNDERMKLYDNKKLTVMDAALQTEFPSSGFFPKSGKELNFSVNGKKRMIRGMMGEPCIITVNGKIGNLHTPIGRDDIITVKESTAGEAGSVSLLNLSEYKKNLTISVNHKKIPVPRFADVNGVLQPASYQVAEGDKIEFLDYYTVEQICRFMDFSNINSTSFMVNNKEASLSTKVYENFDMEVILEEVTASQLYENEETERTGEGTEERAGESSEDSSEERAGESSEESSGERAGKRAVETEPVVQADATDTNKKLEAESAAGGEKEMTVIVNKKPVLLSGKNKYVYVDVFNFISFDLSKPRGTIVTLLNGNEAGYMEELHANDNIEIFWKETV